MEQIKSKLHSTNTVKISSRTSVQSEPVLTSDGVPSLKYKPVILYPENNEDQDNGVFSLEDDEVTTKDVSGSTEDDKESTKDENAAERKEEISKVEENAGQDKSQDGAGPGKSKEYIAKGSNEFLVEPKTKFKWRSLSPVLGESSATEKGKGIECGFCEQGQVNPKLLPCFHSFCRECLEKLLCVRNG